MMHWMRLPRVVSDWLAERATQGAIIKQVGGDLPPQSSIQFVYLLKF